MTTWVSRHDWGARQPRHRPDLPRHPKGVACHYNGPPMGLTDGCDDGHRCAEQVRAIQRYHMDEHDWADIASNFLVCPACERIYEGRGWDVRSAAQGTTAGNDAWHATTSLHGEGEPLTDAAKRAVLAIRDAHQRRYDTDRLRPHSSFKQTACPGGPFRRWIGNGAPEPGTDSEEDGMADLTPPKQIVKDENGHWYLVLNWLERYSLIAEEPALKRLLDRAESDPAYAETRDDWQSAWFEGMIREQDRTG